MKINKSVLAIIFILTAFLLSCSTKSNDPLKNTKKFVKKSHISLYKNGAFHVPNTSIYLIPKGPEAWDFIMELAGMRARESFLLALKRASESIYIVSEGTKISWKTAGKIHRYTDEKSDRIRLKSKEKRTLLVKRSSVKGKDISVKSWELSKKLMNEMGTIGDNIVAAGVEKSERINQKGTKSGKDLIKESIKFSKEYSKKRNEGAKNKMAVAKNDFITGYLAIPEKLKENKLNAVANVGKANPAVVIEKNHIWQEKMSDKNKALIKKTRQNYKTNVKKSLSKIQEEFLESYKQTGVAFGALKAMRWALQSALWDITLKPGSKVITGGLGYLGVNYVAFPVMVVKDESVSVARIAVDMAWNSSKCAYDLTAPSAEAALGAAFGCFEVAGGKIVAGSALTGGVIAGASKVALAKTSSLAVKGGGKALGKTVQYVGVPLAVAGVAAGGKAVGLSVDGAGKLSFATMYTASEVAASGTDVFGNIIAGTTLVGGTTVATVGGAGYGAYQLSKAVAVPSGYELGAGVVLSYDTMTHIAAQSILAVSDCAYLVLSLEGPRWVIYAVKGKTGVGEDLSPGTVLDLKKMQNSGEEIYNLPVSDEEAKKVVQSTYQSLPEKL